MSGLVYSPAPQVRAVAQDLMLDTHTHLLGHRVEFIFRSKSASRHGREVWGRAVKVTGRNAFLAARWGYDDVIDEEPVPFVVIEISRPAWDGLTEAGRRALVDHELTHCRIDDDDRPYLQAHDLEEFTDVVHRNGLWRTDLEVFATAVQLALDVPAGGGLVVSATTKLRNRGGLHAALTSEAVHHPVACRLGARYPEHSSHTDAMNRGPGLDLLVGSGLGPLSVSGFGGLREERGTGSVMRAVSPASVVTPSATPFSGGCECHVVGGVSGGCRSRALARTPGVEATPHGGASRGAACDTRDCRPGAATVPAATHP